VTPGELGDLATLRAQVRVDGRAVASPQVGGWRFSIAASIAWVSRWIELRGGDVIGAGCVRAGTGAASGAPPTWGARVELVVERMGKLEGRPLPA
jgi:2-keto-4-pentenoate hydratase/2-oxohepta-3-ene-1,7-dioic acid hydratase in catechol pathway